MFAVLAAICFIFAAFRFNPTDKMDLVALGLFFLALALLFGNWPMGYFTRR